LKRYGSAKLWLDDPITWINPQRYPYESIIDGNRPKGCVFLSRCEIDQAFEKYFCQFIPLNGVRLGFDRKSSSRIMNKMKRLLPFFPTEPFFQ